jgi:hypothetical protein
MAKQTWKLVDVENQEFIDRVSIGQADVPGAPSRFSIKKKTFRGGLSEGVEEIRVNNGRFEISILPTRGMGLWKAWLGDELTLGWQSPVRGPVHPNFVPLMEPSGLGWLDGFDELLCRCGAESNGAPDFNDQGALTFPLHGRLANRPAHLVEVSVEDDEIQIRGQVLEARLHFAKLLLTTTIRTRFNQPGLVVDDQVTNLSASEVEMQMLYHTNFGPPLLEAGAELVAPVDVVVPRNDWAAEGLGHWSTYSEPSEGMPERVYLMKLNADDQGETQVLLRNSSSSRGVSLYWDVAQLPYFTQWKNETAVEDGYVTGIEPGTNFPNPRSFEGEQGRVVKIGGGATYPIKLGLTVHDDAAGVEQAKMLIAKIQGDRKPTIHEAPQPTWCA